MKLVPGRIWEEVSKASIYGSAAVWMPTLNLTYGMVKRNNNIQ